MAATLEPLKAFWDVPQGLRDTPIGELIAYQNFGKPAQRQDKARLLIGICMDHRASLRVPEGFAYILRVGGANLSPVAFNVSYAVAAKGVRWIALIGHSGCGAVNLRARREEVVSGLVKGVGWSRPDAEKHFDALAPVYEIDDPAAFVARQARLLEHDYPGVIAVPLFMDLADGSLSLVVPSKG